MHPRRRSRECELRRAHAFLPPRMTRTALWQPFSRRLQQPVYGQRTLHKTAESLRSSEASSSCRASGCACASCRPLRRTRRWRLGGGAAAAEIPASCACVSCSDTTPTSTAALEHTSSSVAADARVLPPTASAQYGAVAPPVLMPSAPGSVFSSTVLPAAFTTLTVKSCCVGVDAVATLARCSAMVAEREQVAWSEL